MAETTLSELTAWLETDEAGSRERRARRLHHLLEVIPATGDGVFFCGGDLARKVFNEIRLSYIHSLDLSTVLLTLAYIEREIAARLYQAGWEQAKSERLEGLILKANESNILSDVELTTFQHLRGVRNTYAHFRPPRHRTSIMSRSVTENELPDDVVAKDAKRAIEALGSFFARQDSMF